MTIKNRIERLEAFATEITEPLKIAWFSVLVGLNDPSGYTADNGAVIMRGIGESMEELHNRCYKSVTWIPGEWHDFEAIAA
jgi:hypothetical protein